MSFMWEQWRRMVGKKGSDKRRRGKDNSIPNVATTPTIAHISSASEIPNPFSKYGLDSPPQGENAQSLQAAKQLIKKDGFRKRLKKKQMSKTKILAFLYGRGFHVNSTTAKRKRKIKIILEQPKAVERMLRVLEAEGDRDVTSDNESLYVKECRTLKHYFEQDGSFGFLPNQNEKAEYFFRIQKQGNCFLLAPCVMMAYLFQKKGIRDCAPVDVTKLVRRTFTDEELYAYVVTDEGGDTNSILGSIVESLINCKPAINTVGYYMVQKKTFDLKTLMAECGPGLVTGFSVHKHFEFDCPPETKEKIGYVRFRGKHHSQGQFQESECEDERVKAAIEVTLERYKSSLGCKRELPNPRSLYENKDTSGSALASRGGGAKKEESHAMILIGGRRDKHGKLWLLLQNWWPDMQLVEVSAEYFATCKASLSFVDENVKFDDDAVENLEKCYVMNRSLVADCNNLDRADNPHGCFHRHPCDR
jgi:hypothetical protein